MCQREGPSSNGTRPLRHPLNVDGPFYVEADVCVGCMLMHAEAPELLGMPDNPTPLQHRTHCFVKRQPSSPEELDRAIEAMWVSEVAALRYGGNDPEVLRRLRERGLQDQCDVVVGRSTGETAP